MNFVSLALSNRTDPGQLRLILIFFVNPQVLHASVSSSNSLPNKTGVTRATTNSVPHSAHVAEPSASGGNSWAATGFSSTEYPPERYRARRSSTGITPAHVVERDEPLLIFVP